MAVRKPLVLNSGQIQQLQSGDSIDAQQSGGDIVLQTNDEVGSVVIGTPVYNDANDGVKKAKADAAGTKDVIGLVAQASISSAASGNIQVNGILTATTGQWDAAFGTTGGLTKGTRYYLSAGTAGLGTSTAPSTVGQYVVPLGIGISTTELRLDGGFNSILL
jgi:hypothetical protein